MASAADTLLDRLQSTTQATGLVLANGLEIAPTAQESPFAAFMRRALKVDAAKSRSEPPIHVTSSRDLVVSQEFSDQTKRDIDIVYELFKALAADDLAAYRDGKRVRKLIYASEHIRAEFRKGSKEIMDLTPDQKEVVTRLRTTLEARFRQITGQTVDPASISRCCCF
jgi:hypothetical protein